LKKTLKRIFAAAIGALVLSTNVCGATLSGEQEYTFIHDLVNFIEANAKFPKDKNTGEDRRSSPVSCDFA